MAVAGFEPRRNLYDLRRAFTDLKVRQSLLIVLPNRLRCTSSPSDTEDCPIPNSWRNADVAQCIALIRAGSARSRVGSGRAVAPSSRGVAPALAPDDPQAFHIGFLVFLSVYNTFPSSVVQRPPARVSRSDGRIILPSPPYFSLLREGVPWTSSTGFLLVCWSWKREALGL